MSMPMSVQAIVAYAFGLLLIYLLAQTMLTPLKYIGWLVLNSVIGGVVLLLLNLATRGLGYHIGLNPFSALTVGALGAPGVAMLYVLKSLLR